MAYARTSTTSSGVPFCNKRRRLDSRARNSKNTNRRPTTAATATTNPSYQEIIVAISESRGVSPIVGLAILNLSSAEAVLCQICDTQTYVRTIHKLSVFEPTEVLFANTAVGNKLYGAVEENLVTGSLNASGSSGEILMTTTDRRYWNEGGGLDYVKQLALPDDVEALLVSLGGNYFATSSFAAVRDIKFQDIQQLLTLS